MPEVIPERVVRPPGFCRKKHKYFAKLSIDTGLLATTLIQLRLVLRADKETYPILVYVLLGLISLSLILQVMIMMLYIFVHVKSFQIVSLSELLQIYMLPVFQKPRGISQNEVFHHRNDLPRHASERRLCSAVGSTPRT